MYDHYSVMEHIAKTPLIGGDDEKLKRFFRASNIREIEELFENTSIAKTQGLIAMDDDDMKLGENADHNRNARTYYSTILFKSYKKGDIPSWIEAKKWCRQTARDLTDLLLLYKKKNIRGFAVNETIQDFTIFNIGQIFDFWAIQVSFSIQEVYCPKNFSQEYL